MTDVMSLAMQGEMEVPKVTVGRERPSAGGSHSSQANMSRDTERDFCTPPRFEQDLHKESIQKSTDAITAM